MSVCGVYDMNVLGAHAITHVQVRGLCGVSFLLLP